MFQRQTRNTLGFLIKNFNLISIEQQSKIGNQRQILFLVRRHFQNGSFICTSTENSILNRCQSSLFYTQKNNVSKVTLATETLDAKLGGIEQQQKSRSISLPSNIVFRLNPKAKIQENSAVGSISPRPLVMMFGWMLAEEKHMEKYREFWFERGFDVLSVRTSPIALMFPGLGGKRNGQHMINFLLNHWQKYDEILLHAFSVGGYQMGETLLAAENLKKNDEARRIMESFKGIIIDSCVFAHDAAPGLSRAITLHPILQPILEKSLKIFLKSTSLFTVKRYAMVQEYLFENPHRIPGLVLFSKSDVVSPTSSNEELYRRWKANIKMAEIHFWHEGKHVLLYKDRQAEYTNKVDDFVAKLNISKAEKL